MASSTIRAEYAATLWFQRVYGVQESGSIPAVIFQTLFLMLGALLLALPVYAVLSALGVPPVGLRVIQWYILIVLVPLSLWIWTNQRRQHGARPRRMSAIQLFEGLGEYPLWELIVFPMVGLAVVWFVLFRMVLPVWGVSLSLQSFWDVLFALFALWLFSWWAQVFIWFFAHPKWGITKPQCHWPLRVFLRNHAKA